jgi:hypothetical protein
MSEAYRLYTLELFDPEELLIELLNRSSIPMCHNE